MDKIKIIRKNQKAQICERFISSEPKSKCSLCGKHFLTHSNAATKHYKQAFKMCLNMLPNQLKLF
jgi:hypothetical protein